MKDGGFVRPPEAPNSALASSAFDSDPPPPEVFELELAPKPKVAPVVPKIMRLDGLGALTPATLPNFAESEGVLTTRQGPGRSIVLERVRLGKSVDPRLASLAAGGASQERAFNRLRQRVLTETNRVIAVTSAEPGEGKTTTAANLAWALAAATPGQVLLIEANAKRPALGQVFGFEPADSFMLRLAEHGYAAPPYAVAAVEGARLHIAAFPALPPRHARIERGLFSGVLADLRAGYDYIVIDAPALLENGDASVVTECADGVIIATSAEVSHARAVERALARLTMRARLIGSVVLDA
jgi:Mrp family chromosome partitioning ATPase